MSSTLATMRWKVALGWGLWLLGTSPAYAETTPSIDARVYRPSVDPNAGMSLEPVAPQGPWVFAASWALDVAYRPVTFPAQSGTAIRPIEASVTQTLSASVGLGSILALGFSLPTSLAFGPTALPETVTSGGAVPTLALGDAALVLKLAPLSNQRALGRAGFGLGLLSSATFPTGNRRSFVGEGATTLRTEVLVEYTLLFASVGARFGFAGRVEERVWGDLTFKHALPYGVGITLEPGKMGQIKPLRFMRALDPGGRQSWEFAVRGALPVGPSMPFGLGEPGSARLSPVVLSVSNRIELGRYRNGFLLLGAEFGLSDAVGVPGVRGVLGLGYQARTQDRDGDGVPDLDDACPDLPEDRDGIMDHDGCPEVDADEDGIVDELDACPLTKGVGHTDPRKHGCPDSETKQGPQESRQQGESR